MVPRTIAVIWELLFGALPPPPLSVGMAVLVLELVRVVVETIPDCDVVGVGTNVLIGVEDGEDGV